MAYSCHVYLSFRHGVPRCSTMLTALRERGWELGKRTEQGVFCSLSWLSAQRTQWQDVPTADPASVVQILKQAEERRIVVYVPMHWAEDGTNIEVRTSVEEQTMGAEMARGNHELPGLQPFKDRSWFLERLVPALQPLCQGLRAVRWTEFL